MASKGSNTGGISTEAHAAAKAQTQQRKASNRSANGGRTSGPGPIGLNSGTSTLARAQWAALQRRRDQLTELRAPQADLAMTFHLFEKGRRPLIATELDKSSVELQVFLKTLEHFQVAEKVVADKGVIMKGTIQVACENAAEELSELFDSETASVADAALRGTEWAKRALRWAGQKVYNDAKSTPVLVTTGS